MNTTPNLGKNIRKYWKYVFDREAFDFSPPIVQTSKLALSAAKTIRGGDRPPGIIIHGITKRSGTVYVGQLLSMHPNVCSFPNKLWEVPFLSLTGGIKGIQKDFFFEYEQNVERMGSDDFLPLFGASFIRYLHTLVPQNKRLLVKVPGAQYLNHYFSVFPFESLLVLIRDGRDVVTSTINTWPQIRFSDACRRWDRSAKMILACHQLFSARDDYWMAKYEDAVRSPEAFVKEACSRFHLNPDIYPFEEINNLPVIGSSTTRKQGLDWIKKPENFLPIGRWQQWSAWKKTIFKSIAGQSLIRLEYSQNNGW